MKKTEAKELILDTNFLLIPYQFKIDVFSELSYLLERPYLPTVSTSTVSELERLSKNKGKQGMAARFALKLVDANKKLKRLRVIKGTVPVDDWIVHYAKEHGLVVCTNDERLKNRLRAEKITSIVLRSRSKLRFG